MFKKTVESLFALAIGLAIAYWAIAAYAYFFADSFVFAKSPASYAMTNSDFGELISPAGDKIAYLYLANPSARYTILYSHGNLEDIGFLRPRLELFRAHGFSVLAYDYPGFGCSSGKATQSTTNAAAQGAYDYLTRTLKLDPKTIIVYGRSMGSGPSCYLASHNEIGGLALQSAFVSAFRIQTGIKLLPWDRFDNLDLIPFVRAPILFVHGAADETIPPWHSRMLIAAARVPTRWLWVKYALHNNVIEMAGSTFWDTLADFTRLLDHTNGFDTPSAAQEALTDPPIPADSTPWENNTPPESPDAPSPDPKPSAHL
jgi:hypothetical protein